MRQIDCGHGCFALVDDEDFERLSQFKWYARLHNAKRGPKAHRRAVRLERIGGKTVQTYLHHEILPKREGFVVDHINGNPLDNRRENLRYATHGQNLSNQAGHRNRTSPYKGIRKRRRRWFATITAAGRSIWTSGFTTPEEAARAYDELALTHHGEFARLNFPKQASFAGSSLFPAQTAGNALTPAVALSPLGMR
jgi:hypothetical protein